VATAFFRFRSTNQLILPIFGLPSIDLGGRPTVVTALALCLLLAALIALMLALFVDRPLRHASPLAKLVASLGVMLYFIEVMSLRFGTQGATATRIEPLLDRTLLRAGDVTVYSDALWMTGLAVTAAVVTWLASRYTQFGLATRAVAENERAATLMGIHPEVIAAGNWLIAGVLGATGLILAAPTVRLSPIDTAMLVVPAIAAALIGRFRSPLLAVGAALAIGMLQSEIFNLQITHQFLTDLGLAQGVPLLVILGVLLLGGDVLPARGTVEHVRLPSPALPRHASLVVIVIACAALLTMLLAGSAMRTGVIVSSIATITALSLVVATGFVGQISLATAAFAGISAFALVKLSVAWKVPFPLAPLGAAAVASLLGALFAMPAIRVRGMTLAMATLAAALAVEQLLFRWQWFGGGVDGARLPAPSLFGLDFDVNALGSARPRRTFGVMVVLTALAITLLAINLARSATARRFLAVRANERAATAAGISVTRAKLGAFMISAFLAGMGGALTAYSLSTVSTQSFGVLASIVAIAIAYLTGIATPLGAIVAGVMASGGVLSVIAGQQASRYQFATNGVLLVLAAIFLPDGVAGGLSRVARVGLRRKGRSTVPPHD
jgi:ABC-type branched-subunit amino acid transport system permease subunit